VEFSVVVPTYNRPEQLPLCLRALAELHFPNKDFEVIVADDGSECPLDEVVAPFRERLCLSLLRLPHRGIAGARNAGVDAAKGRFIAFTDDDCRCHPDWLGVFSRHFSETPNAMIGGRVVNTLIDNIYSVTSHAILDALCAHYNANPDRASFLIGANVAVPAAQYRALGGCDESFPAYGGEDRDFCARWLEHGYPMRYVSEALVYHAHNLSARSFAEMYYHYGRGANTYHRQRMARGAARRLEVSFYCDRANLLSPITGTSGLQRKCAAAGLLLLWQLANAAGYVRESWARKDGMH
jgi:GT2 family glycosyltransferase